MQGKGDLSKSESERSSQGLPQSVPSSSPSAMAVSFRTKMEQFAFLETLWRTGLEHCSGH